MKRDSFYDEVRGFAILLVVLGHSIQSLVPNFQTDPLFLGIYIFHMPLFAFLSGMFFARSCERHAPLELLSRRFVQLMVPCLSWGLVNVGVAVVGKLVNHKPMDVVYFLGLCFNSLWYLSTIFGLIVIGIVINFVGGQEHKGRRCVGWLLAFLVLYVFPKNVAGFGMNHLGINHLQFLCPFFASGGLLRERRTVNGWLVAASAVVFAIVFRFFTFDETVYMMSRVTTASDHLIGTLLRIAGGVSGIILSFALVDFVTGRGKWTIGWLARLGTLTLPIYALNQKFFMLRLGIPTRMDNIAVILAATAIVTLLSLGAYFVLSKSRLLALLLFGEHRVARSKTVA